MLVLYNILQLLLLPFLLPLALLAGTRAKYRRRLPYRLGWGIRRQLADRTNRQRTFWLHALSVGEVTSAVPLIEGIQHRWPTSKIVFSVSTTSGRRVADSLLGHQDIQIIDGPIDLLPTVWYFITMIRPDFFILVETDFWPNMLGLLDRRRIPSMLVNGRVSKKSFTRYHRLRFFFQPMFAGFDALCLQTDMDRRKIHRLGVDGKTLYTLGNLKYDTALPSTRHMTGVRQNQLTDRRQTIIAGSTHPGEEPMLLDCYTELRRSYRDLLLIIAPRDPRRGKEIQVMAERRQLSAARRSTRDTARTDIYILDTIGELIDFYSLADLAFVGGSLIDYGGHNPIEPATMGLPVLFGPHMDDFSEIAEFLVQNGGGIQVANQKELGRALHELLASPATITAKGAAAKNSVATMRGVVDNHLDLIQRLISP